jgi:uncharacterized protein YgiM (DUF1202 family)
MHDASGGAPELPRMSYKAARVQRPGSLYESHMSEHRSFSRGPMGLRSFRLCSFLLLLAIVVFAAACSSSASGSGSATAREAALRQIAAEYARTGDLAQAQAGLDKLNLANPGQLLLSLAEEDLAGGRAREEIEAVAALAEMLGAHSQKLTAYLSPTAVPIPTREAVPATVVPVVVVATDVPPAPASVATATPTPTPTEAPPAPSSTPKPQEPRVVADSNVNLRSGPGKAYPVIGQLGGDQEAPIVGRNASGDWWQIETAGARQGWVAGTVVRVLGAIDTVAVAQNIPAPPTAAPRPTAAPQPTAAPVAAGPDFRVESIRLWNVTENGGTYDSSSVHCGEKRELHIIVVDKAGNPLDGVTLVAANSAVQDFNVTGSKGPGRAEYVMGGGYDVSVLKDADGREVTSEWARGLTANSVAIPFDLLIGAGYCRDTADCQHFYSQNGCYGHHSWTVTFRRAY